MTKRFSLVLAVTSILLLGSLATAAGVTASPTVPVSFVPQLAVWAPAPAAPAPLVLPLRFEPQPMANACIDQCRATYSSCLDDCVTAPFPGCYDFCRFDVLYPCYISCIQTS